MRLLLLFLPLLLAALACAQPSVLSAQNPNPALRRVAQSSQTDSAALVVLVHGMGRTSLSMFPLQFYLERAGYRVLNFHYSSYGPSIADIAGALTGRVNAELMRHPAPRVHFVGHSLGNIVVRALLARYTISAPLGRTVMLAPPNRGSRAADRLTPYTRWLLAPISELRTTNSTVARLPLPPPGLEFAIIAGERDGKVSIAEACLSGANAFAVVPSGHTFIMMRPKVLRMLRQFLETGSMPQSSVPAPSPCV